MSGQFHRKQIQLVQELRCGAQLFEFSLYDHKEARKMTGVEPAKELLSASDLIIAYFLPRVIPVLMVANKERSVTLLQVLPTEICDCWRRLPTTLP